MCRCDIIAAIDVVRDSELFNFGIMEFDLIGSSPWLAIIMVSAKKQHIIVIANIFYAIRLCCLNGGY